MSDANFEMCGRELEDTLLPDQDLINHLEFLLRKAQAAEIHGIAYTTVSVSRNGAICSIGTAYIGEGIDGHVHTAMGGLEVVKHRILHDRMGPWQNGPSS